MPLQIAADENIPYVKEAFGRLGEVTTFAGRKATAATVRAAEALLVRSVTPVHAALLDGSRVRFVGTATIGVEHVDQAYLAARQIAFASAQGSNANSVAEYVMTALLVLAHRKGLTLAGKTLGIVGVGNVGSRVARLAPALGLKLLLNDPPLARQTGDPKYRPLEELLARADVLTFHVPFEKGGQDPTYHLIDAKLLARLRPGTILFNTSRGGVADNPALLAALRAKRLGPVVLDVWEHEPTPDPELLAAVDLATPHIAGYSLDGKANGTKLLYDALAAHLGRPDSTTRTPGTPPENSSGVPGGLPGVPVVSSPWSPTEVLPAPTRPRLALDGAGKRDEAVLLEAATALYAIEADDARLRRLAALPEAERGPYFDKLRKEYPVRREFPTCRVALSGASAADAARLAAKLRGLGFRA